MNSQYHNNGQAQSMLGGGANQNMNGSSSSPKGTMNSPIAQPDPQAPQAQGLKPQGQLAALLRNRPEFDVFGSGKDIARSSSAPPTQAMNARTLLQSLENVDDMMDPRADPEYAAFFYSNSRLDPRLPPPIYAPGQSWQVWSNNTPNTTINPGNMNDFNRTWMTPDIRGSEGVADGSRMKPQPIGPGNHSPPNSPNKRRNLVDMIQQDFPRTPSPVFAAQQLRSQQRSDENLRMSDTKVGDMVINPNDLRMMTRTPPPGFPVNVSPPPRASSTPPDMVAKLRESMREGSPLVPPSDRPMSTEEQLLNQFQKMNMSSSQMDGRGIRSSAMPNGFYYEQTPPNSGYSAAGPYGQEMYSTVPGRSSPSAWNRPSQGMYVRPGEQYTGPISMDMKSGSSGYYVIPADQMRHSGGYFPPGAQPQPQQQQGYFVPNHAIQANNMAMSNNIRPPHQPMMKKDQRVSDPGQAMRSAVLEEFRNNKSRRYELLDIAGHVVEFSSDQYGSRFIQQKLEVSSNDEKQMVFEEILPNALKLMTDVFGNYVVQKFFEYGSAAQKAQLVTQIRGHVMSLSLQMYGCRVIQKALEYLPLEQQKSIIGELEGHILQCVKDQNGNHVIQKAIERISSDEIDFLISALSGQVYDLATHPYGCRVMQRVFEHCPESITHPLLEELRSYTPTLVQDQYGNYVIQHILEKGRPEDKVNVIKQVKGQVLQMSKHKFASNVVEKCIASCNPTDRQGFIDEIVQTRSDGTTPLVQMMKDQYANYVIQKLLEVANDSQRDLLISKIRPHFSSLRKFTYGKHIIAKIEKLAGVSG